MTSRAISPPSTKRRKFGAPEIDAAEASSVLEHPSLVKPLLPGQLRIVSWNVNGIAPFLQIPITSFFPPAKSSEHSARAVAGRVQLSLRACLARWQFPQVVCLQEVKIAAHDVKTQRMVQEAVKAPIAQQFPSVDCLKRSYRAFFELPRDKYNARGWGGKVYGVCSLIREDLLEDSDAVPEPVDWDQEGRVLQFRVLRHRLVVFNVYAVNGTENPYRDSTTGEVVGTRHTRKRLFHQLLRDHVRKYENDGWSVVIAGDLNIARVAIDGHPGIRTSAAHVTNRADFESKFMTSTEQGGLGMIDSFRQQHGAMRKYSYHPPNAIEIFYRRG